MKKTGKTIIWTLIITVLAVVLSLVAMTMGRYHISISQIFALFFPTAFPNVEVNDTMRTVILNVRLPRVLLALIAGAGLSVSGAAFQALFSNPLATPDVLGVATAASFGAALGILFGLPSMGIQILALIAGLIAVAIVWIAGSSGGRTSLIMIILSGMMVSAFFSAMVSLIKYTADPQDVL
ncbi:MAG: iron chelate uptake ABC transporter family permease subunit, partial [Oscillospiraceae bacterium]